MNVLKYVHIFLYSCLCTSLYSISIIFIVFIYLFMGREPKCILFPLGSARQIHLWNGSSTLSFFLLVFSEGCLFGVWLTFESLANAMPPETLCAHFHQSVLFLGVPFCNVRAEHGEDVWPRQRGQIHQPLMQPQSGDRGCTDTGLYSGTVPPGLLRWYRSRHRSGGGAHLQLRLEP